MSAVRFLINPAAGGGRARSRLAELARLARRLGGEIEVSESADDFTARARRAVAQGLERLVVVGGDGSAHHAIQVLAGTECALGIVPAGSGNDLARSLGIPRVPDQAMELAARGPARPIDLGQAGPRLFASVAGCGLYGAVAALAARARIVRGPLVYAYALLRVLAFYEPPGFRVQFDGGIYHDRAWMVAFANTPVFGGGMRIAPGARVDDGLLDLVVVREVRRRELLRVFPRVYRGGHVGHPAVVAARTAAATIEVERPETCYGDGEPIVLVGPQPLRIAVRTAALRVVAGEPPP